MGFVEGRFVPRTIDSGPRTPIIEAIAVDLLLLGLLAAPHSVMARPLFKRRWTRIIPAAAERSTYVLTSSLLLALVLWQWRSIPRIAWDVTFTPARVGLEALSRAGWTLAVAGTFAIDHSDLFGLRRVTLNLLGRPYAPPRFVAAGLQRIVRHPIMLGFLVAFWSAPTMTAGRLLFAAVTTAYVLVALRLEERDLLRWHGEEYERYRRGVPMLLPRPGPGGAPVDGMVRGNVTHSVKGIRSAGARANRRGKIAGRELSL